MNLKEATNEYLKYLKLVKNSSPKTIETYTNSLKTFANYISDQSDITQYTKKTMLEYYEYLNTNCRTDNTKALKITVLKSFFSFIKKQGIESIDPFSIENYSVKRKISEYVTVDDLKTIIDSIKTKSYRVNPELTYRNIAILILLFTTGLRVSELVTIKLRDVDFNAKSANIIILGKGSKLRTVYLNADSIAAIRDYLTYRRSTLKSDYLFTNQYVETKLTSNNLFCIIKELTKYAGIEKKLSPHKFRHGYATKLYESGIDIRTIQTMMGHSNISTTQIYAHVSNQQTRKAFDMAFGN